MSWVCKKIHTCAFSYMVDSHLENGNSGKRTCQKGGYALCAAVASLSSVTTGCPATFAWLSLMTSFLTWCVQALTKVLDPSCEDDSFDALLPAAAYSLVVKHRQTAEEEQPSCIHWGTISQSWTAFLQTTMPASAAQFSGTHTYCDACIAKQG